MQVFFITKSLNIMTVSRDNILSDSYFIVIKDATLFMTTDWGLDSFVFTSGFIYDYSLVSYASMGYSSDHAYKHGSFRENISSSFFIILIHKWVHMFSNMSILTLSVSIHNHTSREVCSVSVFTFLVSIIPSHMLNSNALIFLLPRFSLNIDHHMMTSL